GSGDQAAWPSWVAMACHTCSGVASRTTSLRISKCLDMTVLLRGWSLQGQPASPVRRGGRWERRGGHRQVRRGGGRGGRWGGQGEDQWVRQGGHRRARRDAER